MRSKLKYDEALSNFAFNFNLRPYMTPSSQEKMAMYRGVSCILCPVQLGAFKQCTDGGACQILLATT